MSCKYLIGLPIEEVPTPALLVDLDLLTENMETMAAYLQKVGTHLRPHAKTHKTPAIGHMQMRHGAVGLCCATVGEAEAMVYAGIPEVLIANEVVEASSLRRAVNLCRQARILMIVDEQDNAAKLATVARQYGVTVEVLVDLDVGQGRCGARSLEQLVELAQSVRKMPGLRLMGVFGYEGHLQFIPDRKERTDKGRDATEKLVSAAKELAKLGMDMELVTGAGTGTYDIAAEFAEISEIQAGSYIFMDGTYQKLSLPFKQSLSVLSSVVSCPAPGVAIFDVGLKGISPERFYPRLQEYSQADAEVKGLSEEHATVLLREGLNFRSGQKHRFVPSHCCSTVNLYDVIVGTRQGKVECIWPVAARRA